MNKTVFPIIALFIGIFIMVAMTTAIPAEGEPMMPLLTLLLMAEFGVIVSLVGLYMGSKLLLSNGFDIKLLLPVLGCAVLAVTLGIEGLDLWDYINSID